MNRKLYFALLLALATALILASAALAQDNPPPPQAITDDQINAVARDLYCPVCENIPLDVCPTQACAEWRELIREKLAAGWSEDQIKQYFVDQFGDRVLATPPARGLNWLVYIVPPVAILAGVYLLYRALLAWRRPLPEVASEVTENLPADDEYVRRLEEELKKM